jgi:hypothetical protein
MLNHGFIPLVTVEAPLTLRYVNPGSVMTSQDRHEVRAPEHARFHKSLEFKRLLRSASWQPACYHEDQVRDDADTTTRRDCDELRRPRLANRKCRRIGRKA